MIRRLLFAAALLGVVASSSPYTRPASAQEPEAFQLLIIGDSFSAGNGTGAGYFGPRGCYRSTETWGAQLGTRISAELGRPVEVDNKACSGAETEDLVGSQGPDVASPRTLEERTFRGNRFFSESGWQADAEALGFCRSLRVDGPDDFWVGHADRVGEVYYPVCQRQVAAQVTKVYEKYDLVVMTIGGNDAGFGEIGHRCLIHALPLSLTAAPELCDGALRAAEDLLARDTDNLASRLSHTLSAIERNLNPPSRTSPGKVLLLSYPYLSAEHDYQLDGVAVGRRLKALSDRGEQIQREVVEDLNSYLSRDECGRGRLLFADGTKSKFNGHEQQPPIGLAGDANEWLWQAKAPMTDILHPKPSGHAAKADVAMDALVDAAAFDCGEVSAIDELPGNSQVHLYPLAGPHGELAMCARFADGWHPVLRQPDGSLLRIRLPGGAECDVGGTDYRDIAWNMRGMALIPMRQSAANDGIALLSDSGSSITEATGPRSLRIGGDGLLYGLTRGGQGSPASLSVFDPADGSLVALQQVPNLSSSRFVHISPTEFGIAINHGDRWRSYERGVEVGVVDLDLGPYAKGGWSAGQLMALSSDESPGLFSCSQRLARTDGHTVEQLGVVTAPFEDCTLWFATERTGGGLVAWTSGLDETGARVWVITWIGRDGEIESQTLFSPVDPFVAPGELVDIDVHGNLVVGVTMREPCVISGLEKTCNQAHIVTFSPDGAALDRRLGDLTSPTSHADNKPVIADGTIHYLLEHDTEVGSNPRYVVESVAAPELGPSRDRSHYLAVLGNG